MGDLSKRTDCILDVMVIKLSGNALYKNKRENKKMAEKPDKFVCLNQFGEA